MAGKESPQLASLTARDKELATAALLALKGNWDIDYNLLARFAPYKNEASARVCFAPAKKKLLVLRDNMDSDNPEGEAETEVQTPKKKKPAPAAKPGSAKKGRPSKRKVAEVSNDDNDDEGFAGSDAEGGGASDAKRVKQESSQEDEVFPEE